MAKRKDYDLMNYAKYRESRRRFSRFGKSVGKFWRLGRSIHKKTESERGRRRRELDRKMKETEKVYKEKNGPISAKDIAITVIVVVAFVILIDILLNLGIVITTGIIIAVIVIAFLIYLKYNSSKDVCIDHNLSEEEINELHRYLENIDMYKNIVNSSTDLYAVRCAMDELLDLIDLVMSYEEGELNEAGMSKVQLPEQKKIIEENYDRILEQVAEGNSSIK